ncbi:MAG: M20 family metallopeptidase [Planctomycetota bacterium]|jgi:acetylornithine deacetylase/succinyl-diaminopimelate desuccinylase-like protein|nr:M20 family metallopeptidase [Planctomycetota bacterium]MDP6763242.1 M20 family metallopeptidase [Planctomycetota bacterium]MDP6990833.1 M20 family metallopeptidase [Planctomycetota bacterium]
MDAERTREFVERTWRDEIVPALVDYIRIPAKSPHFDADWAANGHIDRAVELIAAWCAKRPLEGLELEVVRLDGRTPVIYMELPGEIDDTVLLYGHLDKQPEMTGWAEGLGPWEPVLRGDRLYGRGGADDGYAAFASLTALEALAREKTPHGRCVVLIEACEESGSYDLPAVIEHLRDRIGEPQLVVCLDSGCGNYDQLWSTTSLRGMVTGTLSVEILNEGVHSGDASGIVPSSFRILRSLLSRVEDQATGEVLLPECHVDIPPERVAQAAVAAGNLGAAVSGKFPFVEGSGPVGSDPAEQVLARTWRPALSVTGAGGLPALADAGNVLRPATKAALSLRLPPAADSARAAGALKAILEADPPYGARVNLDLDEPCDGWNAPRLAPWLEEVTEAASRTYFGRGAVYMGEGGSIPFMGMLGEEFPAAQFLITGVLGPGSNAHGPNEFLDVAMGIKLTCCVADVLAGHHRAHAR